MLPGVKIVNVGNEAVQLNFMDAHEHHRPCPPQINIDLFCRYARDLFDLVSVDAILISCSTMNRAFAQVRAHMKEVGVPVIQIDEAMMEEAVNIGGRILVVATHGPTVKSTQSLLQETADRLGKSVDFDGITTEAAFDLLGQGRIMEHNALIDRAIRLVQKERAVDVVVLAQLSMSVFSFYRPDPVAVYGIPVLNSGQTGFRRASEVLARLLLVRSIGILPMAHGLEAHATGASTAGNHPYPAARRESGLLSWSRRHAQHTCCGRRSI